MYAARLHTGAAGAVGREARPTRAQPARVWRLDWIVLANSLLMLAYHASGTAVLAVAGHVFSAAVVVGLGCSAWRSPRVLRPYRWLLGMLVLGIGATLLVNQGRTDPADLAKFLSLFALYFAARASPQALRCSVLSAFLLLALPLVLAPFGSRVHDAAGTGHVAFSYFQTRNAAVIYYTGVLFHLYPLLGRAALPLQLGSAMAFGKIGAIVASLGAFTLCSLSARREALVVLPLGLGVVVLGMGMGLLDRPLAVLGGFLANVAELGPARISAMSYAEIVTLSGSRDVSAYFRIKHWAEIWQIYAQGSPGQILFGFGPGQSKAVTLQHLVPHNDYLRILAEFGAVNFGCFLMLIVIALRGLPEAPLASLFMVYVFYSVSENLLDNFAALALLFGGAGLYARERGERGKADHPP